MSAKDLVPVSTIDNFKPKSEAKDSDIDQAQLASETPIICPRTATRPYDERDPFLRLLHAHSKHSDA